MVKCEAKCKVLWWPIVSVSDINAVHYNSVIFTDQGEVDVMVKHPNTWHL